jgi:hypothetical protein
MTKQQLREYCEAEFENIDTVLSELSRVAAHEKTEYSVAELAAIATFIHNFYNGLENILKRILMFEKTALKDAPTWHKNLLQTSLNKNIISAELYDSLSNYLSFRHFFVHSYSFTLRWNELKPLVDDLEVTWETFRSSVIVRFEK